MTTKRSLPVIQDRPPTRIISASSSYDQNTLTGLARQNGSMLVEEVCIDLSRPEHGEARELLGKVYDCLARWKQEAGEKNCGTCRATCCTSHWGAGISVTDEDVQRLADYLRLTPEEVTSRFMKSVPTPTDEKWIFDFVPDERATSGARCPFLTYDKNKLGRCSVYEARPRTCREYAAYTCLIHERAEV